MAPEKVGLMVCAFQHTGVIGVGGGRLPIGFPRCGSEMVLLTDSTYNAADNEQGGGGMRM
jgi:hypothetical protein